MTIGYEPVDLEMAIEEAQRMTDELFTTFRRDEQINALLKTVSSSLDAALEAAKEIDEIMVEGSEDV